MTKSMLSGSEALGSIQDIRRMIRDAYGTKLSEAISVGFEQVPAAWPVHSTNHNILGTLLAVIIPMILFMRRAGQSLHSFVQQNG